MIEEILQKMKDNQRDIAVTITAMAFGAYVSYILTHNNYTSEYNECITRECITTGCEKMCVEESVDERLIEKQYITFDVDPQVKSKIGGKIK